MRGKIFKIGNSMVMSISQEVLDAFQLSEGSEVSIELDLAQGQVIITSRTPAVVGIDALFKHQVSDFIEEYRPVLNALAQ